MIKYIITNFRTDSMSNGFAPYTDTKNYRCLKCGTSGLVRLQDFDRFWVCLGFKCERPVDIEMRHPNAGTVWVNRVPASVLQPDDELAIENKKAMTTKVFTSRPAQGKSNKWYLSLQEIGPVTVDPNRLYDRVL